MKLLKAIFIKYKEIILYLIIGLLTTIVSLVSYYICVSTFLSASDPIQLQIANVISWILSVAFAYYTNRKFVFESKENNIFKECISFVLSRILTLILDMVFMFAMVTLMKFNDSIAKLISQVFVIVGNYIISKFLVFKKN